MRNHVFRIRVLKHQTHPPATFVSAMKTNSSQQAVKTRLPFARATRVTMAVHVSRTVHTNPGAIRHRLARHAGKSEWACIIIGLLYK
jgi:hypothetical protein